VSVTTSTSTVAGAPVDPSAPWIVSPDDHLVEPKDLWTSRLSSRWGDAAPRVVRVRGQAGLKQGLWSYEETPDGEPTDCWIYDDKKIHLTLTAAAAGFELDDMESRTTTYDEIRPGCFSVPDRLADMDLAGIDASICFPGNFVRFCGQRFYEAKDKALAHDCVTAYNDFMVEEWAGGSDGRLVPLGIVPLWDPVAAGAEVRRNAARGVRSVCFSEMPPHLDMPSVHTTYWDPFFAACEETETVVMMHIGSSSRMPSTSKDAPVAVSTAAMAVNSAMSMLDWLFSGVFDRFTRLKICYVESQVGWVPYFLERADRVWDHNRGWNEVRGSVLDPPSSYFRDHIFCSFFHDPHGLRCLDEIGEDNVMFETDYPHSDTNWPNSRAVGAAMVAELTPDQQEKVLHGNASRLFGLTRPLRYG